MKSLIELIGWYGTIAIILAYGLVSFSVLQPTTLLFQVLNGTGALGILIESYSKKDYQPAVLNTLWMLVAVVAIFRIVF